jgi:hypothetical protein
VTGADHFADKLRHRTTGTEPILVSTKQAALLLGYGKTKLFQLLKDHTLESVLLGPRSRRVDLASIRRLTGEVK